MSVIPSYYLPFWISITALFIIPIGLYIVFCFAKIDELFGKYNPFFFCVALSFINCYILCIIDTAFYYFTNNKPIEFTNSTTKIPLTVVVFFLGLAIGAFLFFVYIVDVIKKNKKNK